MAEGAAKETEETVREEVVIVGLAGRFPGAPTIARFWANLRSGVESIRSLTQDEMVASGVDRATFEADGFVAAGAPLEHADTFDADFFGYTRREAELMDPQHRVFLECAWSALEDAGYDPASYPGVIGLFGGVAPNTFRQKVLETRPDIMGTVGRYPLLIGSEREYAITRTAFKLGLEGPAISVNTACSTSGVALHLACQSVLSGECDMALAGGARVAVPLAGGYEYELDGILSPDGHCRVFDADGRGTVVGSGVAIVVVKRLSDAQRDGDTIRAVVRGTAINNDGGHKIGFTAPSVSGQEAVIRQALEMAEVDAASIGYVEAHGTGTFIGDPIEVEALTRAYRHDTDAVGYCRIGSVKSNIGHLDAGAGMAGVVKAVLSLEAGEIPPTLNFSNPNPQIDFDSSPFQVNDRLSEWPITTGPRRAAVSSFGLGGTNAHVVLEQAPVPEPWEPSTRDHHLLVLSARTAASLDEVTTAIADHLREHPALALADVSHTLALGRRHHPLRRAVVARDASEAAASLSAAQDRPVARPAAARPVLFMFPGGGAQHVGMGRRLYATEQEFRSAFDRCAVLAERTAGLNLRHVVYGRQEHGPTQTGPETVALERPAHALPALFATEYATARLLESLGIRPDLMIGHSMGEYTAACLAGVMSLESAMALVIKRGELFETLAPGAMLSVLLSADDLKPRLGADLSIAVINAVDRCTVAGGRAAIALLEQQLEQGGVECRRLRIDVAAHSHLVEPLLKDFGDFVSSIDLSDPSLPYISNLTGNMAGVEVSRPEYWVSHLRQTVLFADGLGTALAGDPKLVVEVGPGQVLTGFAARHPERSPDQLCTATMPHPTDPTPDDSFFLGAVGRIWACGASVSLGELHSGEQRRRVPLPTYAFERVRHWIEPGTATPLATAPGSGRVDGHLDSASSTGAASNSPVVPESQDRLSRLSDRIVDVFCELSGMAPADLDPHATFLDLGLDSLFMTQATAALGAELGMRISFRQLLEDAPTVHALSRWLDAQLPPEAFPAPPPFQPVADRATPAAAPGGLEQIAAQLASLQQQVAALSGQPATDPAQATTALVEPKPGDPEAVDSSVDEGEEVTGPWRPPDRRSDELDAGQRRHIEDLTERLVSRSPTSKLATAANRGHLADPRTVAGFRRAWKEIVYPVVAERSAGSKIWDLDGNEYLDVAMGFGVNLFGHSPPFIVEAVTEQLARGIEIGPQTPLAGETAALVAELTGHQRVAFCNTGSEAVLAAMRLARTVTGRNKIVTFANDYHGIFDEVLARGVSRGGVRTSIPLARGIPSHAPQDLIIFDHGDPEALAYVAEHSNELAAVLIEPIQSRHPDHQPADFLRDLRRVTAATDVALIFDEMITGFRSHPGGAQALFGVRADLATYGKVAGGGFPIGIVAGAAHFMDALDGGAWQYGDDSVPEADVTWFAGTFVRHPVALAASRAALLHLREEGPALQRELNARTTDFVAGLNDFLASKSVPMRVEHFSSLFLTKFDRDQQFASLFYFHLRDQGIHITEGRAAFLSTAHSDADLVRLDAAYRAAVEAMVGSRFLSSDHGVETQRGEATRELPVTEVQQEIWLAARLSSDANCAYNLSNTLHITGELDVPALQRSLQKVVARHDALRVSFSRNGSTQRIAPSLSIDLPLVDLTEFDEAEREYRLAQQRGTEVETAFDLTNGPLIRAQLVRMGAEDHHLFLTVHHAVCDGWSSGTVLSHLAEIYTEDGNGTGADEPRPMQLTDFVDWFEAYRSSSDRTVDEAYWTELVADGFPTSDLPGDRPRPARKTYRADRRTREVDPELVGALRALAAGEGSTLFTLLLGSFECLLANLAGQDEVGLAVAVAGQTRFPGRDLVAHCTNALPLRRPVDPSQSFADHLATTRSAFLDAFDHQDFSYGAIVGRAEVSRDPSRTPLVSIMFNMDSPANPLDMGGAIAVPGSNPRHFENFDVFLNVVPSGDGLVIECTYNLDLFDAATIDRRLDEWISGLSSLHASGAAVPVTEIDFVPRAEREWLAERNATDTALDGGRDLLTVFSDQAPRIDPHSVAVESGGTTVLFGEFRDLVSRLAARLAIVGVEPGSLVGVLGERSLGLIVGVHGVAAAGAGFVALDADVPDARLAHMISESGVSVVVCEPRLGHRLAGLQSDGLDLAVVDIDEILSSMEPTDAAGATSTGMSPDDVAYVMFTSGSTGRPKGVANTHQGIANRLRWMQDRFPLGSQDAVLAKTPFGFDVSVWELFWPLSVGARLVVAEPGGHRDPAYLVDTIVSRGITLTHFVPSMLRQFLEHPDASSCSGLRWVVCSGETLPRDLVDRFAALLPGVELHNLYGPTEAAIDVTAWRCQPGEHGPVPIGTPVPNTSVRVVDASLREMPIGIPGELVIGGVQVAAGYAGRDDLTAAQFVPNPAMRVGRLYRTGDLGRWSPDGFLEFLGRIDTQVKVRGQRVELGEIEAILREHPAIGEAAVMLRPDSTGDPLLVAYLVPGVGQSIDLNLVRRHLKGFLPTPMIPARFLVLAEPPLTTSGKLDRTKLPAIVEVDAATTDAYVAPRTDLERELAELWSDVLAIDSVGAETDFFDLGGHSLKLTQLATRIERAYGVRPSLASLFDAPTVAQHAVLLMEALMADADADLLGDLLGAAAGDGVGGDAMRPNDE